jgi:hypothetical protein
MERKLTNARLLRSELGLRRDILVDGLDGDGHLAYGGLPNMTWVVGRGGRILYKADWTSAENVEAFVHRYRDARRARRPGSARAAYSTEQLEYRDVDRQMFYQRLRRNGARAYEDFKRAEESWSSRG